MKTKTINRLKAVLAEKQTTNKWLAEKMKISTITVSRWCTNKAQPSLETLMEIAEVLEIDARKLLVSIKEQ